MCSLRIFGANLDVDAFLRAIPLPVAAVHRRGHPRFPTTKPDGLRHEISNINITVSDAAFSDLASQLTDAQAFLRAQAKHLRAAKTFPGVDGLTFDFPIETRDVATQSDTFPASLLAELGALAIDLEVSRYPSSSFD